MSKLLLIVAILSMGAAGYFGWQTKGKAGAMKGDLDQAKTTLTSTKMQLTQSEGKVKAAQEEITKAKTDLDAKDKELSGEKEKRSTAETLGKQLQDSVTEKDTAYATLKADYDKLVKDAGGKPDIAGLKAELAK